MARIYAEQDAAVLRIWNAERNELVGPMAQYYSLIRGANVDPLYSEPTANPLFGGPITGQQARHRDAFEYIGPREVIFGVVYEQVTGATSTADNVGIDTTYEGEAYVSRNEWEARWPELVDGVPRKPKKGDVLYVNENWWDVVGAKTGGHVTDSAHWVECKLELRKRDRFAPERKI